MSSVSAHETVDRIPMTTSALRETLSRFATGVIVLSVGGENIHGMTANAFSSVSLEPAKVLCCVSHSAVMHKSIMSAQRFGISVLGAEQEHLARHFADKNRPLGHEQFTGFDWTPGPVTQSPLLKGAIAWLECELAEYHDSGDHSIFIGDVVNASSSQGTAGLLFFKGGFQQIRAVNE
ncbi:flavin reductase family protein [Streptomyces spinoverrucosus]|uniref:flavin reductase family protein n=1 Tax=Streptomyces spinoverrucosus TaxID=284043 RepID=UPI0018C35459|nr:flavin reductase family protein [Streptomyces spinoverrucosus]MBG0856944.1 flavin reductase family protein [Streptomyces spinoverrucosus]